MPWLYNPTKDVLPVTLVDGTSYGFLPKKKVYIDPSNTSSAVWQLVGMGKLINRGGDPIAEEPAVEKPVSEVDSELPEDQAVIEVKADLPALIPIAEPVVVLEVVKGMASEELIQDTSSSHQDSDDNVLSVSSVDVDSEKQEKAVEKQEDAQEKQDSEEKGDDLPAFASPEDLGKTSEKRGRRFKRNR